MRSRILALTIEIPLCYTEVGGWVSSLGRILRNDTKLVVLEKDVHVSCKAVDIPWRLSYSFQSV